MIPHNLMQQESFTNEPMDPTQEMHLNRLNRIGETIFPRLCR